MAKIKLTESRASQTGSYRPGDVIDVDDATAERIVGAHQAEFVDDPDRTQSTREAFGISTVPELLSQPPTTPGFTEDPDSTVSELDDLDQLAIDDKALQLLRAPDDNVPAFATIGQLIDWLDEEGDLTEKVGIGPKTANVILEAVEEHESEFEGEDAEEDGEGEE